MRRAQGYARMEGPALRGLADPGLASLHRQGECDTFTCGHCQMIVHVPVGRDGACVGGLCRICNRLVCPHCADRQQCTPFEEAIERQLWRAARLREW